MEVGRKLKAAAVTAAQEPAGQPAKFETALRDVPNHAECTLLSELGVAVAKGRLVKERRKMNDCWIDPDMVAVELLSLLEASVTYPYNNRYPLAGRRSSVVILDGYVGATIVWAVDCVMIT